jgi:hypothetical protein
LIAKQGIQRENRRGAEHTEDERTETNQNQKISPMLTYRALQLDCMEFHL